MYDPKFSVKQMYKQYGSTYDKVPTKKVDTKPSRSSGFGGMGPDPAERFGGSPTRGLGSKPDYSSSAYDSGGADNNPNRDAAESMGVVKKVLDRAVTLFRNFGVSEPEDVIVDGKRVYKGPLFRGFTPDTSNFGITPNKDVTPSLPPSTINIFGVNTDNPSLNMFGVTRSSFRNPDPFLPPDPMVQPKTGIDTYAEMKQSIDKTLEGVVSVDYTIKRGDTLSEIAQDRGTTVDVLLKMNNIKEEDKDTIFAGEKLKVPPKKAKTYKDIVDDLYVSSNQIMSDAYDPDSQYYQSQIPMDQRDFAPEDLSGFGGMGPDPSTGQGIMSPDYDTVEKAQERLNDLGYTTLVGPLVVDGVLGKGTARQLRKFQATAGIPITGKLDEATKKALRKNSNKNKEGKDPTAIATDLSEGLFQQIKAPVAKIESGGEAEPYATIGGDGMQYDGKYQFGWRAKADLRNNPNMTDAEIAKLLQMNPKEYKELSDEEKVVVGQAIQTSRAAFRADPNLQEKAFRLYINQNHDTLTKNSAKYRAMDDKNKLAVLGYAHNQGAEAALEWLTTEVSGTDAFGTKGDKYSEAIIEELKKKKKGK